MSYTDLQNNKTTLQSILATVNALPEAEDSLDTSDATITPETVFLNETGYANGQKVTGTFTIEDEVETQEDLIAQISAALEGKTAGGSGVSNIETCTVTFRIGGLDSEDVPLYYMDSTGSYTNNTVSVFPRIDNPIDAMKNSLLIVGAGTTIYSGDVEQLDGLTDVYSSSAFHIYGDCVINIST